MRKFILFLFATILSSGVIFAQDNINLQFVSKEFADSYSKLYEQARLKRKLQVGLGNVEGSLELLKNSTDSIKVIFNWSVAKKYNYYSVKKAYEEKYIDQDSDPVDFEEAKKIFELRLIFWFNKNSKGVKLTNNPDTSTTFELIVIPYDYMNKGTSFIGKRSDGALQGLIFLYDCQKNKIIDIMDFRVHREALNKAARHGNETCWWGMAEYFSEWLSSQIKKAK